MVVVSWPGPLHAPPQKPCNPDTATLSKLKSSRLWQGIVGAFFCLRIFASAVFAIAWGGSQVKSSNLALLGAFCCPHSFAHGRFAVGWGAG